MTTHLFMFKPGLWLGEGKIVLNMVEEELKFYTKWNIQHRDFNNKIAGVQEIQINGITESMRNELVFFDFQEGAFSVEMENLNIGKVQGQGIYDENLIAWEFRSNSMNFEGYETYYLQEDNKYKMHAEYVTSDQFRTLIDGKIWLSPGAEE